MEDNAMKISIGSDEAGYRLKEVIKAYLQELGHDVADFGTFDGQPVLYPNVATEVAEDILQGNAERGVLICGTGIGMCISANKVPGIRAALCHDTYSAERARKSNDAQILCMGERVIGPELAKAVIYSWLRSEFAGGGSIPKVERMKELDEKYRHVQ
jgi:ribose 5-phosphate isomerase B